MTNAYSLDDYIVEIHDRTQHQTADIELIKMLLGKGSKRVLEPFCGSGRIFLELARCGHEMVGMDNSAGMLAAGRRNLDREPVAVRRLVSLSEKDVLSVDWPAGFDAVLLANNSLYELPAAEMQRECVRRAGKALKPGGHLYLDNYCVHETLSPAMRPGNIYADVFPTGTSADGTRVSACMEIVKIDRVGRQLVNRHNVTVTRPDGEATVHTWVQERHLPNIEEFKNWLGEGGFKIEGLWGDRDSTPYTPASLRAVAWAVKVYR